MVKQLLFTGCIFFLAFACQSDENSASLPIASNNLPSQVVAGTYFLSEVLVEKSADRNAEARNLVNETEHYNGTRIIIDQNKSITYIKNCPVVNGNDTQPSSVIMEGIWEVKSQNRESAMIMATCKDEEGSDLNMMFYKEGDKLYLKYAIADFPDHNISGKPCYSTGKVDYIFTKEYTML